MNTESILGNHNDSCVLFAEIRKNQKWRAKQNAARVIGAVNSAEENLTEARNRYKIAKKRVWMVEKALKKYKKTGDEKYLADIC